MNPPAADKRAPVIDFADLRFRYPGARDDALCGLDLQIGDGEFVVVVGANGSGKSTLARLLGGLDTPTAARHAVGCGRDLLTEPGRVDVRRDVGVLFQNPDNQLVAQAVEADIAFGLENLGWGAVEMRRRVDEMLARFQLVDLRHREPHLLSGGQKQRTALAGVLAVPRRLIVLDEPTAMLDAVGREEVLAAVAELHAEGLAIVLITQEMDEVVGADRVVALEMGSKVFEGTAAELFANIDLVVRLRLGLPAPGALAGALGERGRRLSRLPLTIDELLEELASPV
jgi:energy-coupling factor transport system ATP-binding protein